MKKGNDSHPVYGHGMKEHNHGKMSGHVPDAHKGRAHKGSAHVSEVPMEHGHKYMAIHHHEHHAGVEHNVHHTGEMQTGGED